MRTWTLDNGLKVLYEQGNAMPLAGATLLWPTGSRHEPHSMAGLSSLTIDLLMQGTVGRTARQIAQALESIGASMGTQGREDYSEMGLVVPAANFGQALAMMREVVRQPTFPADEINKEKAHVLASLESRKDSIFNVAYDALNTALYGDHAYGRLIEGTSKTVRRLTRPDCQDWHKAHVRPRDSILSIVAPWSTSQANKVIREHFDAWKPWTGKPGRLSPRKSHSAGEGVQEKQVTVRSPFEQAYLMVGWPAPQVSDPDHLPLKVLNTLIGGGMSSRLFVRLREEMGLAYEVSSFYPTRIETSQWVIYLGLPEKKLTLASKRLWDLLQEMAEGGPTMAELRQAKAMIRGAFLMDRQSRRRQAWYAAWWEFLGRGPNYGEEFLKSIDAITLKTVHSLARRMMMRPRVTVRVVPK
jgi:zinc protease